jgi:hypothetical protein
MHPLSAPALTDGYRRAFQISALITFVGLLVSFALPRLTGRQQKIDPQIPTPESAI